MDGRPLIIKTEYSCLEWMIDDWVSGFFGFHTVYI